jgi:hypothetical protein
VNIRLPKLDYVASPYKEIEGLLRKKGQSLFVMSDPIKNIEVCMPKCNNHHKLVEMLEIFIPINEEDCKANAEKHLEELIDYLGKKAK